MKPTEIAIDLFQKMAKQDESALEYLSDKFTLAGPFPQPVSKMQWRGIVKNMNAGLSNFSYNPSDSVLNQDGSVTMNISVSGKHTGVLMIPNMDPIKPTQIEVQNPKESITLTFERNKVVKGEITPIKGGGVPGILRQLGVSPPNK